MAVVESCLHMQNTINNRQIIGRILTGFQLSFRFLVSCLKTGVTFVNLKDVGHFDEKIASLN